MNDATDFCDQKVNGDGIAAAFRDDDISIALAGFNEGFVHDPHSADILVDDVVQASAAFLDITQQPSDKTDIGIILACILTNSVRGFPFLHPISSIYCL